MKLVFIHGRPGVGKLSIARELAKLTGFGLFHNHLTVDLVSSVFAFGSDSFVRLREQIWLSMCQAAAGDDVSVIFTFSPERTVREQFIEEAVETVETAGGQICFIELTCAPGELLRRIENPSRREFGKLCSIEQYQALEAAGAFRFRELPRGLSIDTTDCSPAGAARLINDYLVGHAESPG